MKRNLPRKLLAAVAALSLFGAPVYETLAQRGGDRAAPIPRGKSRPDDNDRNRGRGGGDTAVVLPDVFRSIDGTGNNVANPDWGAHDVPFLRLTTVAYSDGVSSPSGTDRPSAREVSNAVAAQTESVPNSRGASDYLWQWGQFLDHDIDETPALDPAEAFNIPVPAGDPFFDPFGTGTQEIGLNRSYYELVDGVAQQFNEITAYVDASNVYGSTEERAYALRTLDGTGKLKTSEGDLLPYNTDGLANAPTADAPNFFLAGDVRANEQIGLIAMHTLFVREHNFWAESLAESDPNLSGEELYQMARAIVAAEMQVITYREFLPLLLGRDAIPPYRGYRPNVDAGIANVFATAAYRVGHTMLSSELQRIDAEGDPIAEGNIALADAFFVPSEVETTGIDPILRGLASQQCQEIDNKVIDDVRNFLFGPPGSGGFDLASLNIQRGRDHGLPGYNEVRRNYGLRPVSDFSEINPDAEVADALASVYDSVEDVDVWVGGLAEPHARGAMVGPTFQAILADQFTRLRDGDRFWYQSYLDRSMIELVERQTLADVIRRNTDIGRELSDNVFLVEGAGNGGGNNGRPPRRNDDRRRR